MIIESKSNGGILLHRAMYSLRDTNPYAALRPHVSFQSTTKVLTYDADPRTIQERFEDFCLQAASARQARSRSSARFVSPRCQPPLVLPDALHKHSDDHIIHDLQQDDADGWESVHKKRQHFRSTFHAVTVHSVHSVHTVHTRPAASRCHPTVPVSEYPITEKTRFPNNPNTFYESDEDCEDIEEEERDEKGWQGSWPGHMGWTDRGRAEDNDRLNEQAEVRAWCSQLQANRGFSFQQGGSVFCLPGDPDLF
eukprot:g71061.t1